MLGVKAEMLGKGNSEWGQERMVRENKRSGVKEE